MSREKKCCNNNHSVKDGNKKQALKQVRWNLSEVSLLSVASSPFSVDIWLPLTCFPSEPSCEFIVFRQPKTLQISFLLSYNEIFFPPRLLMTTSCRILSAGAQSASECLLLFPSYGHSTEQAGVWVYSLNDSDRSNTSAFFQLKSTAMTYLFYVKV